jgi:hypothetical protein
MKITTLLLAALFSAAAHAQLPLPLMDTTPEITPGNWASAAPLLQAALECRQLLNPADPVMREMFPANENGQWSITPPKTFRVFGLSVEQVNVYIDPDGDMGASYSTTVAAPLGMAEAAIKLAAKHPNLVGTLMTTPGERPSLTAIDCTIAGDPDAADTADNYQE